jgi:uncharacterized protein
MFRTIRPFFIALVCSWIALFAAALYYSSAHPHSHWIMTAALPAFLLEAFFYTAAITEETRIRLVRIRGSARQAALLWLSAVLPYLVFSLAAGTFQRNAFYLLVLLCGILAFWYVLTPRRIVYDIGFLAIAAAPILLRVFRRIYLSPDPQLRIDALGHLMWIRLAIVALLVFRKWNPGAFGFWPRRDEWRTGMLWYGLAIVPIVALALGIHDVRFEPAAGNWWQILGIGLGTFFGILWVVALSEELFFRGVIERAILKSWGSPVLAVGLSALFYGSAHLWFRHFPDWRRALVAGVLGVACGIAYLRTDSVRASMVTHAFVVATWRMFFK